jgi:hypothetical protein
MYPFTQGPRYESAINDAESGIRRIRINGRTGSTAPMPKGLASFRLIVWYKKSAEQRRPFRKLYLADSLKKIQREGSGIERTPS